MFKLMIADDNPFVLNELSTIIDWEDFDMCITGTFSNGKSLLDAAKADMPDVVLTDISMPIMNGMDLANALRQLSSDVKIIFISSYADFTYAQKALQMQIFEYILKPFEEKQLSDTMARILKELQTEYFQRYEQNKTLKQVETFRMHALEKYMCELLYHTIEDSRVLSELTTLEVTLYSSYKLQLALITPDNETGMFRSSTVSKIRSILYAQKHQDFQAILMPVADGHLAILFICKSDFSDIKNCLAQLSIDIETMTGLRATIGFSRSAKSFADLPMLYVQAKEATTQAYSMHIPLLEYKAIQCFSNTDYPGDNAVEDVSLYSNGQKITSSTTKKYIKQIKEYIEAHYAEQITTRDVSSAVYLSTNYANHIFTTKYGFTIYEYVTQCRIEAAKKLLRETDKQVALIAELVGYQGKTNFYISFKRNVGITPTEYRRRAEGSSHP
ncbi:MAG: response regulator [Lachnospiraceae bacterium]|nr:response regulator [Lachnospiraceae bacterium]